MTKRNNKYIFLRGDYWNYVRNVPLKYKHVEPRLRIRKALNTQNVEVARMRRDALVSAEDSYWLALALEAEETGGITDATRHVQQHHYQAATKRALAFGYIYKTAQELRSKTPVDDVMERVELLGSQYDVGNEPPPKMETVALLGGVAKPKSDDMSVSVAFQKYVDEIAFDSQHRKSPAQRKSWEKAKRTSINYFIEAIGDIDMASISRATATEYKKWWAERIKTGDENGSRPTPYTANRHMGNMRSLHREFFEFVGEDDRANPFRKLSFKEDKTEQKKKKRPPFSTDWVRTKILIPGMFDKMNAEARNIMFTVIETGARPSEICNLRPENIRLNEDVPHIEITAKNNREVKATDSNRIIPLVGIALEAMKKNPNGFPRYFDKETAFSAVANKALKSRNLFPTSKHKVYSFRHSFEDRMVEAEIDYALRCRLMGHKNERPDYGSGGSLEYQRDQMLKFTHPYKAGLVV